MKVFISHSSIDKPFAEEMIESIGRDSVIFDKYSFDPCENINNSIVKSINESEVFVLLVSNSSLNSTWVKEEVKLASELMIKQDLTFLPYCIDPEIKAKDPRLDEWVWNRLIKTYTHPKLAARAIQRKLNKIIAAKFPDLHSVNNLFIGRNIDMSNLEKNHYREDLTKLKVMFISGFPFVGRKTLHKRFITQYIKKNPYYQPITVRLSSTDSIEQLVIQLNEYVGLKESSQIFNYISQGSDYAISLCEKLVVSLIEAQEKIIIEDDVCIVKPGGSIVDWFLDLLHKIQLPSEVVFYVSTRFRPNPTFIASNPMLMEYPLSTLHRDDMYSLFKHCIGLNGQKLNEDDIDMYVDYFSGYPKQAIDAATIIKTQTPIIAKKRISMLKESYDGNYYPIWDELSDKSKNLVIMMAKFDFINTQLLVGIYNGEDISSLLEEIESFSLYETFGQANEYLCLCPAFSDFITRSKFKLSSDFEKVFRNATKKMLADINCELTDISSNLFAIKEMIRTNPKNIKEKFLVPSFVLKVIIEEYHQNHDEIVVEIAHRIINDYKKVNYDSCFDAIHYWLCCSLCRLQDRDRFEQEISFFSDDKFDYNYLYGFYFRHNSKKSSLLKSKQYYQIAISQKEERDYKTLTPIAKVEHELVIVMMKLKEFSGAISTAKINYQNNPRNSYHIRAYYNCLVHTSGSDKEELLTLLKEMKTLGARASSQFLPAMEAQYEFYVNDNFTRAIDMFRQIMSQDLVEGRIYTMEAFRDICNTRGANMIYESIVKEKNIDDVDAIY
ncbi:MAG: toll/interleukin-1 receptor domain-containing protein [Bacteroidaceae bacterium]|nr:toll/interleukin-1 receptor domain-containing protein [Bacteroidaceae bacterium]